MLKLTQTANNIYLYSHLANSKSKSIILILMKEKEVMLLKSSASSCVPAFDLSYLALHEKSSIQQTETLQINQSSADDQLAVLQALAR